MNPTRRLWITLGVIVLASFAVLGWMGREIHFAQPPIPDAVRSASGELLYTRADYDRGREVWQSIGGQQLGSIWGHGGYVAPDWSADWLHREAVGLLDRWSQAEDGIAHDAQPTQRQAALQARLRDEMRTNTYDAASGVLTVSDDRAAVIAEVAAHYRELFSDAPALRTLRDQYAIHENAIPDASHRAAMTAFFFWSSWATVTSRPGKDISYTQNWPHEPLVGNGPTPAAFLWTVASIVFLLAGVGALAWYHAATQHSEPAARPPQTDPLATIKVTPSMRASAKFFWLAVALFGVQVLLGAITAHYAVEGQAFYGFELSQILPYALSRTWHTQLSVLWIATAWLGTGLYIAPALSAHEPRLQRFGVNLLFGALLVVVVGAFSGQWFAVMQRMGLEYNFWFGHQGWEYVDLGRFWQIGLFIGLMLWLALVGRALAPALKARSESRTLIWMLFLSTVAIGLFYAAGLMWGKTTHLSMVEYWRWWVVHLWVEGFFEVFATAVIALLFARMGLVRTSSATVAVLFATIVFLTGGVLGTFHHLYWSGTPTAVLALGASFSALEVVPLVLIGFEAWQTYRHSKATPWVQAYRWPILFFVAVAFWNLVGAGLFGFLINPPLALYYMQGLNTTPLHGHTALFGVYGMLGIGLMLFCLRGLAPRTAWNDGLLKTTFWSLNLGLAGMALLSLLPIGVLQVKASVEHGFWYARSAEFVHDPLIEALVWMRVPGDVVFSVGVLTLAWFVVRLYIGPRRHREAAVAGERDGLAVLE
jgi:nitric oxide reductase subunit B